MSEGPIYSVAPGWIILGVLVIVWSLVGITVLAVAELWRLVEC